MGLRLARLAIAIVPAALVPACFSPELTPGLPCAVDRDPPCPDGQVCDTAANVCVFDSALDTWRDDSATDFTDPTAVLESAVVEPNGAIGPTPYFVEGVAIAGIHSLLIGDGNEATAAWDPIAAAPITGRGFFRGDLDLDTNGEVPGTELPDLDGVTIRLEGEIYLDAGDTELQLDVDDRGFFDLGDGTGAFTRLLSGDVGPDTEAIASVPADGWYPFRGAVESDANLIRFILRRDDGNGNGFVELEADRVRASVNAFTGLAIDGFGDAYLFGPTGTGIATAPLDQLQNYGDIGHPAGAGDLGNASWSVRWSGQVLVTTAGAFAFRLDTEGGHRFWLDGDQLADVDDATAPMITTTTPVTLDPGWHDVVLDVMKDSDNSTPAHAQITIASGPELVDSFFPVDHQRPLPGRGARWSSRTYSAATAIPDMGSASRPLFLDTPSSADPVIEVDYLYDLTHPVQATVGATLTRPGATPITLFDPGDLTGTGAVSDRLRFYGVDGRGNWTLAATDTTLDVMTGSISQVRVSATYRGGPAPFPTTARYASRVRDLGGVIAYSGVRWQTRQARPDQIAVSLRSCDAPDCAQEPWTRVAASGDPAGIAPRRYAQYQVEITTDGDVPAALDWIEIDYRVQ